jgi:hypothetical protein
MALVPAQRLSIERTLVEAARDRGTAVRVNPNGRAPGRPPEAIPAGQD